MDNYHSEFGDNGGRMGSAVDCRHGGQSAFLWLQGVRHPNHSKMEATLPVLTCTCRWHSFQFLIGWNKTIYMAPLLQHQGWSDERGSNKRDWIEHKSFKNIACTTFLPHTTSSGSTFSSFERSWAAERKSSRFMWDVSQEIAHLKTVLLLKDDLLVVFIYWFIISSWSSSTWMLFVLFGCSLSFIVLTVQEPVKSRAPQLHLEYRFYKTLGSTGKVTELSLVCICVYEWLYNTDCTVLED